MSQIGFISLFIGNLRKNEFRIVSIIRQMSPQTRFSRNFRTFLFRPDWCMKRVFSAVYTRPARDPYLPQAGTNHENLAPIKGYTTSSIKGYTTSVHGQAARLPARSLALRDEGRDLEFAYWNSVFFVFVNILPLSGKGRGQVLLGLPFFYLWTGGFFETLQR
jgi:hypothetical protein